MKVLIIGAGAIGMLYGSYFHQMNIDVSFLTRSRSQSECLHSNGIMFHRLNGKQVTIPVTSFSFEKMKDRESYLSGTFDFILVTVKQTHLAEVLPWIDKYIPSNTLLLFLMNGLGHQEKIKAQLTHSQICLGITSNGVLKSSPNHISEKGRGPTKIGAWGTLTEKNLAVLATLFSLGKPYDLQLEWSDEIEIELWKKCLINACINPLTALFQVKNGYLLTESRLRKLMYQLYKEQKMLVEACRPNDAHKIISNGVLWQEIKEICRRTSENISSMFQDITYKRQTEIDSITGYLLDQADRCGIHMSYHRFLHESIHILQNK